MPEDLFLNDVLPYAFITETRDSWRPVLYAKVAPLARAAATRRDAIVAINRDIVKLTGVKYTPAQRPPQQSPLESISFGTAGAPGLSILLAAAFRSAGLPARLCGTPRWGDLSGDHLWVEVWDDGWHFTEYYPDEGGLDHGWIPEKAALADPDEPFQRVVATTWKPGDELFRMAWAPGDLSVPAVNRTAHYAALAGGRRVHVPEEEGCLAIRVFARAGGPQVAVPIVARQAGVEMKRGTTSGAPAGRDDFFAVCGEPSLPMSLEYGGKTREVKFEAGKTTSVDLLLEP